MGVRTVFGDGLLLEIGKARAKVRRTRVRVGCGNQNVFGRNAGLLRRRFAGRTRRINRHTDAGALTVLLQDEQPGLQVQRDGRWRTVEPRRGALVINIGDIIQVWSNDRYPAPLHRVIASTDAPRYSAAYFFNPAYAVDYAPLPGTHGPEDPPHYRPINW